VISIVYSIIDMYLFPIMTRIHMNRYYVHIGAGTQVIYIIHHMHHEV
jgi:hypothetical protein